MTKRDEIKKVKKSNIHDSAIKLFSNKGYFQTSISDISKEANISKGLLYHYYSSKEELFEEIVIESVESILNYLPKNEKQEFSDDDLAYFLNKIIIPSLDNNKAKWMLLILLLSQQKLFELALKHLTKSKDYVEFENILQKYFETKGYEKPDIEVELFTSSLMGICIQYITNPSFFPFNAVMEQFVKRIISKS